MIEPFGTAEGTAVPTLPIRRSHITPGLLLDVMTETAPGMETTELRICILDGLGRDPLLSVEDGERRTRVPVAELAREMEQARVVDSPAGVRAAFRSWIDHRPVTDKDAAATGIAVCGWVDPGNTAIAWQVVVRRRMVAAAWRPSPLMSLPGIAAVRAAAQARSLEVPVQLHVAGAAAVWTCPAAPALSTAALVAPEWVLWQLSRRNLTTEDIHLVVSPPNPFVCAPGPVARRLAGESNEPNVTLEWEQIDALGWS